MRFNGEVLIIGHKVGRPSKRLTLHQKELVIKSAFIRHKGKKSENEFVPARINTHKSYDELRLHTEDMLYPGTYEIEVKFSGKITRAMNGIYPCYFTQNGQEKKLIATQFESHHAREVFPCIDEPEAKATFDLSLETETDECVISNTPVKSQKILNDGNAQLTVFETTPVMSTYLLAFVYGNIHFLEAKTKTGVVVRTYATSDNVQHTKFALDIAVKCLEFYDDYFAISYPLKKCDLIALPDFAAGAMENWGCITFREQTMLVDPDNTALVSKQYVAMVVAHELAHQWFGNLVTMRWWTDLWLNEGFASWIEFLAVDNIFPQWQMWTQFSVDEQQQALKLDALEHTHPIEVPVNHPDEIRSIFDAISYSKGASVIHMLHEYLGPDNFRGGLQLYLNHHAYGNTDTVNLWEALEEFSNMPVRDFMHVWTSQPGYPLVHAEITANSVQLTQERFFINPNHKTHDSQFWPIPLLTREEKLPKQLTDQSARFQVNDTKALTINSGQGGFYRVAYSTSHLKRLGELIRRGRLTTLDRLGILSDVFEAARSGKSDTADGLEFIKNFQHETDYAVWDVIAASLGNIKLLMGDDKLRDAMKPFIRHLAAGELKRLGWNRNKNESHFDSLLRPIILGLAASADEPAVVKKCLDIFNKVSRTTDVNPDLRTIASSHQVRRGVEMDPDMRGVVFGTVARHGNEKDFKKMIAMHNSSTLSEERVALSAAITGFKQPNLIKQALGMIISKDVRLQDTAYWIAYSFLNRHANEQAWKWVKDNWSWLENNIGSDLSFYRLPIYTARAQNKKEFKSEYVSFFKPRLSPALERSYNQGLEMLDWQSAWRERDYEKVLKFFKSNPQ